MNPAEQAFRSAVVKEAMSWLGTPYAHAADIKGAGVDCGMILVRVYADLCGLGNYDPRPYPIDWHLHRDGERYLEEILPHAHEIFTDPLPGDILLYRYGRTYSHSAIVIDYPTVIHAFKHDRCVLLADASKFPFEGRERKVFSAWRGV